MATVQARDPCPCGSGKIFESCCREWYEAAKSKPSVKKTAPTATECGELVALFNAGHHTELENRARLLLERYPESGFIWNYLGVSLRMQGKDGLSALQKAAEFSPDDVDVRSNLGNALNDLGRLEEAEVCLRRALQIDRHNAYVHWNLGITLKGLSRIDDAKACFRRAIWIKPDFAEAHFNLGNTLQEMGHLSEAETNYRRALQIKPDFAEAHRSLGSVLQDMSQLGEAAASYRKAYQLGFHGARINEALMVPAIMGTRQEMLESRARFEQNLDELIAGKMTVDDNFLKGACKTNFYLAYHGLNDRDLLLKVAKFYAQACPSLLYTAPHCAKPRTDTRKKIRIGFISKFMFNHSIGRTTRGLLANVARDRFHVTALFVPPLVDDFISHFIRDSADSFLVLPSTLKAARDAIAGLELDILFYQDIGMEVYTYFLAFSRLAPVQCVSFGHPDTTGIPGMDYWVSSDNFEPEGAQAHYSEQLFLLRNLGTLAYYYRPALEQPVKTRRDFGLPQDMHLYLCPQSLFKVHPDFDAILADILRGDAQGEVVMIDGRIPAWGELLRERFKKTIPDVSDRIRFLPPHNSSDFLALIAACDVMLDTICFNGMNTTLEAFAVGTPVVTMPTLLQRGRHTSGMYKRMDMSECVARSPEEYVNISLRLGTNKNFRKKVKAKILTRSKVLYEDKEVVREFERFFVEAHGHADIAREKRIS